MIVASLYFKYISKEWLYLSNYYFLVAFIGFLIFLILPESPKFLLSIHDYERARKSFNTIAYYNNRPPL
jgi:hypothetical protein